MRKETAKGVLSAVKAASATNNPAIEQENKIQTQFYFVKNFNSSCTEVHHPFLSYQQAVQVNNTVKVKKVLDREMKHIKSKANKNSEN